MRRYWIAAAITFACGLAFGPRVLHHVVRQRDMANAVAHRDISRLELASYRRYHQPAHMHVPSIRDPWGTPYRMTPSGQGFAITSAGPDRVFGTADDVR